MSRTNRTQIVVAICFSIGLVTTGLAQGKNLKDGAEKSNKSAVVFREIMDIPEKSIPKGLLDKAECIGVFPNVIKAGFIVGGRGGSGVASCRTAGGWSAPAYFEMKGGSFGLQIGAESTDFVLLFMNEKAMQALLKSKFTLGGEASVAAGPVGRTAAAETDATMTAEVLSYSRSKGVFGGLELKGTAITADKKDIENVYGSGVNAEKVLRMPEDSAPKEVQPFPETLFSFTPKGAK